MDSSWRVGGVPQAFRFDPTPSVGAITLHVRAPQPICRPNPTPLWQNLTWGACIRYLFCIGHYLKLITKGEDWGVAGQVNQELCLPCPLAQAQGFTTGGSLLQFNYWNTCPITLVIWWQFVVLRTLFRGTFILSKIIFCPYVDAWLLVKQSWPWHRRLHFDACSMKPFSVRLTISAKQEEMHRQRLLIIDEIDW